MFCGFPLYIHIYIYTCIYIHIYLYNKHYIIQLPGSAWDYFFVFLHQGIFSFEYGKMYSVELPQIQYLRAFWIRSSMGSTSVKVFLVRFGRPDIGYVFFSPFCWVCTGSAWVRISMGIEFRLFSPFGPQR